MKRLLKQIHSSINEYACPIFALVVLIFMIIGSYLCFPGNTTFVSSILTIVLAGATVTYAHSAWCTLNTMKLSRLESFRPIVSIRVHDREAGFRGATYGGSEWIDYLNAHIQKKYRYGLFLENTGKGSACEITIWSNLKFDEDIKWSKSFIDDSINIWPKPHKYAHPLGINSVVDLDSHDYIMKFSEDILANDEFVMLIQYKDVFNNIFITLYMKNIQRVVQISKALRKSTLSIEVVESEINTCK